MTLKEAKGIVESGNGVFGNKYHDACDILAREHQSDPCPPELKRTKMLRVDGFECNVYYNYVPPYSYGAMPINHWWGFAQTEQYYWKCPLCKEVKTLEEACDIILPLFTVMVKRWKKLQLNEVL